MDTTDIGQGFLDGSREELQDIALQILEGEVPSPLKGFVFMVAQMGNVNSKGLPFAKTFPDGRPNPDYQSPILNGDGLVYKFSFADGQAKLTTRLMKPPCYYADEATRQDGPATAAYAHFSFKNMGIGRLSFKLGSRNFLNTAFLPVWFKNDDAPSLLVTDDVARPFKMDPKSMNLLTPIGKNLEWHSAMPSVMKLPFPLTQSTAHPSWDPLTKEFFSVNYLKSFETEATTAHISKLLLSTDSPAHKALEEAAKRFEQHGSEEKAIEEVKKILAGEQKRNFLPRLLHQITSFFSKIGWAIFNFVSKISGGYTPDRVYLFRFGGTGEMEKWQLVDEQGNDLKIRQCMHQTYMTEHYIVFMDASFKFGFELLFNNPVPSNPGLDRFFRAISAKKMEPFTNLWLVKRKDLDLKKEKITVISMKEPLPYECIHFSAEYDDGDGVTLYTIHNNTACMAEWIRPYDTSPYDGASMHEDLIGYFAVCPLAIGRTGKFVIDPAKATFKSTTILREPGNLPPVKSIHKDTVKKIGANTWGLGLLTHRDQYSPDVANRKIKNLYYLSLGARRENLTQFVFDLYKDYPWREIPLNDMLAYIDAGVPQCVLRVDTADMKITDSWTFDQKDYLYSIQFVPASIATPTVEKDQDGYLFLTMKVGLPSENKRRYRAEIWIFKAWDLAAGPVCKLAHPKLIFPATLHTCYLPTDQSVQSGYSVNIKDDYTETIESLFKHDKKRKKEMTGFFNEYIFPHFPG